LRERKPYPCRVAGSRGRESVAVETRNGCAIWIAYGRKRGQATVMVRSSAGHGLKLSVSTNSPHPRTVHVHNHVHRQSVSTDWQRIQLAMNRQWQQSWIVRRQSAVVNFPRTRTGHGHDLSAVADRQRIVPVPASPLPQRRRPVSRFISNQFQSMTTFDPAEVRKAVAEFIPRRPQKFHDIIPAKEVIVELRQKGGSYRSIADLLTQHCLPTSKTAVAMFCHQVLGENIRPRKRSARKRPPALSSPNGESAVPDAVPTGESGPPAAPVHNSENGESAPTRSRGPRIAQIRKFNPTPNEKTDSHP
jgi:hypothetical protein